MNSQSRVKYFAFLTCISRFVYLRHRHTLSCDVWDVRSQVVTDDKKRKKEMKTLFVS